MGNRQDSENLSLIMQLAEKLGINLKDSRLAIATRKQRAKARTHDGSLEITVIDDLNRPTVRIDSPRASGIWVELVDNRKDSAPKGAIYRITTYMPYYLLGSTEEFGLNALTGGDIYEVYVGREGIILNKPKR